MAGQGDPLRPKAAASWTNTALPQGAPACPVPGTGGPETAAFRDEAGATAAALASKSVEALRGTATRPCLRVFAQRSLAELQRLSSMEAIRPRSPQPSPDPGREGGSQLRAPRLGTNVLSWLKGRLPGPPERRWGS